MLIMNEREEQISSLVKQHAPAELVKNEESYSYLCSLLSSSLYDQEEQVNYQTLVEMIDPFFGQQQDDDNAEYSEASRELAKQLSNLRIQDLRPNNSDSLSSLSQEQSRDLVKQPKPLGTVPESEDFVATTASESDDGTRSAKAIAREKKLQERRTKREARRQKKQQKQKTVEVDSVEELDDNASAWQERRREGKAWGGRGHGGRGVRGDVNTASNIHLHNVSLSFAGNDLLENSTIQINGGHRYGLIGRNGCGKSTLLRRLAQKAIPGFPQDVRVLFVQQHLAGGTESAVEALLTADEERTALLLEQEQLEQQIENTESGESHKLEELVERLGEIASELDAMDADGAEERARDILRGLQFTQPMMEIPTSHLSGGWKMRVALAQALFVPSDLLLFDEPTNHLDLHALLWLTDYLVNSNKTLIVVSHDRVFLDMCTDIISFEHKKLKCHVGNYSAYQQQQAEQAARQAQILDASERQRAKAVAFVEKQQHQASKKSKRPDPKKQRQAKMIKEKKLDRIGNYRQDGKRYKNMSLKKLGEEYVRVAEKVVIEADEPVLKFKFPAPTWPQGMGDNTALLKMDELSFAYNPDCPPLLLRVTLDINRGSKVAVVGRNGAGKSTLMKLITGEQPSKAGSLNNLGGHIWRHPCLRIGHVTQHSVEDLEQFSNMSVVSYAEERLAALSACSDVSRTAAGNIRQYLGAFGLGGKHATRAIGSLSGGERMRLCFATVLAEQPQVLVLDEPTNHIDLETLDSLASALDAFEGAVVIVSHNQGFLSGFCKELWVVENGEVDVRHSDTQSFDEMFTDYRSEAMDGVKQRGSARATKARLAKQAKEQRVGTNHKGGFIG